MVVAERRTEDRAGRERGRHAGHPDHVDVVGRLGERGGGHGVHARVPAADQCDGLSAPGLLDGGAGPLLLGAQPGLQDPGARPEQVADLVDVLVEPDECGGPAQSAVARGVSRSRRRDRARRPRAARARDAVRRRRWPSGVSVRPRRLPLGDEEFTAADERGRLGHGPGVPTAASGGVGGLGPRPSSTPRPGTSPRAPRARAAAATMPGSSGLASTWRLGEAARGQSRVPQRALHQIETSSTGTPLDAPTPTTRDGGRTSPRPRRVRPRGPSAERPACPACRTRAANGRGGQRPRHLTSSATGSPSSRARVTPATSPSTGRPRVSRPGMPTASVAVVTTGSAPSNAPRDRESSRRRRVRRPARRRTARPRRRNHSRVGRLVGQQGRDEPHDRARREEAHELLALRERPPHGVAHGPVVHPGAVRPGRGQPVACRRARRGGGDEADHWALLHGSRDSSRRGPVPPQQEDGIGRREPGHVARQRRQPGGLQQHPVAANPAPVSAARTAGTRSSAARATTTVRRARRAHISTIAGSSWPPRRRTRRRDRRAR